MIWILKNGINWTAVWANYQFHKINTLFLKLLPCCIVKQKNYDLMNENLKHFYLKNMNRDYHSKGKKTGHFSQSVFANISGCNSSNSVIHFLFCDHMTYKNSFDSHKVKPKRMRIYYINLYDSNTVLYLKRQFYSKKFSTFFF